MAQQTTALIKATPRKESGFSLADVMVAVVIIGILSVAAMWGLNSMLSRFEVTSNQLMVMGKAIESYTVKHPEEKFPEQEGIYLRDYVALYGLQNAKEEKEGLPSFINIDVKATENNEFFTICALDGKTSKVYSSKTNTVIDTDKCPLS